MAVTIISTVFWGVTPCVVGFGKTCCPILRHKILLPQRWKQKVLPTHWCISATLHGVT